MAHTFTHQDPGYLDRELGPVRSRIMGKFAKGTPAPGTAHKMNLSAMVSVGPFILRGKLGGKARPSPFFVDGKPIATPQVLSAAERDALRAAFAAQGPYRAS